MFAAMSEPPKKSERLNMVISAEELEQIEDWRRQQPKVPSRSEAIRQLIQIGLTSTQQRLSEAARLAKPARKKP
jgi:hypothetical protein